MFGIKTLKIEMVKEHFGLNLVLFFFSEIIRDFLQKVRKGVEVVSLIILS